MRVEIFLKISYELAVHYEKVEIKVFSCHCKRFSEYPSMSSNFDFVENCPHSFFPLYSPTIPLLQIKDFANQVQSCRS